jgi:hypothetical protein
METAFLSIRAELKIINERLTILEGLVANLNKDDMENISVAYKDLAEIKTRVAKIEQQLKLRLV